MSWVRTLLVLLAPISCVGRGGSAGTGDTSSCSMASPDSDLVALCEQYGFDARPAANSSFPPCTFPLTGCVAADPMYLCVAGGAPECEVVCFHESADADADTDVDEGCGTGGSAP